jgi:pimeloyl-ACP methyl ester carboxylesterase
MKIVISKDGTPIAFDQTGQGPALILVGGAFQFRAIDPKTSRLANLLSPHFSVFHYDRRGRGESGDTPPYSVDREIEDIEALINEAGGSAFVFGMSSGGALALLSAAHGLAIKKLAVYEIPFNLDPFARSASENYSRQLKAFLAEDRRGDAVAFTMVSWGTPSEAVASLKQTLAWPMFESVAPTLAYDDAIMGGGAVPAKRLSSIKVPTLVIDGGMSPEFMDKAAQAVADAIPGARRRTLEGQTHDVAPEVLAPVLAEFFLTAD